MSIRFDFVLLSATFLCLPQFVQANVQFKVTDRVAHGNDAVGTNSKLTLTYSESGETHPGVFLGKLVLPAGDVDKYMYLDEAKSTVFLSDPKDTEVSRLSYFSTLHQYDQVDGTCTGYAMDHLLQQMHWSGFTGNGKLADTLSTEYGRTQLLVETINNYYLATQHKNSIEGILNQFGTRFGFTCPKHMYDDSEKARAFVEERLAAGLPVLISFWIGPTMVKSNLKIQDYESRKISDDRLWVPRQVGERNSGGHSVVAVSEFETKGRKKLLMLDSDWHEPRIWDLEEYLGGKVAIDEIEFYGCNAK